MSFDWLQGLSGGFLIGSSAALFLLLSGRISGISGILEGVMEPHQPGLSWRVAYLAGLPLGVAIVAYLTPQFIPDIQIRSSWPVLFAAGLLVGFGARLGNGCTSGHGVCGISRLSRRSTVATITFFAVAAVTVFVCRYLFLI